jgi:hypothetical protein
MVEGNTDETDASDQDGSETSESGQKTRNYDIAACPPHLILSPLSGRSWSVYCCGEPAVVPRKASHGAYQQLIQRFNHWTSKAVAGLELFLFLESYES